MKFDTYHREYEYRVIKAIDESSYEATVVGDIPYRFTLDGATPDRLRSQLGAALTAEASVRTVREVAIEPGYIEVVASPGREGTTPNAILQAIRDGVSAYNQHYAEAHPHSTGYLDGLELGDAYVAARPTGDGVEAFIEEHCSVEDPDPTLHPGDGLPSAEEPVVTWGTGESVKTVGTAPVERDIVYEFVIPLPADLYDPRAYNREINAARGVAGAQAFAWDSASCKQLRDTLSRRLRDKQRYRVEAWVDHLRIRAAASSLNSTPTAVLEEVAGCINHMNHRRGETPVYEDRDHPTVRRLPLRFGDRAYVGVAEGTPDRADEWIHERGLDDEELAALATGLEDQVADVADALDAVPDADNESESGAVTANRLRRLLGGGR